MSEAVFEHWRDILLKLQKAEDEIKKTQIYNKELEIIKCLQELIKEQAPNESFDHTVSQIR